MDRFRTQLVLQGASIALLSVSLWYFFRTRRRSLQKSVASCEWDRLNWQRELEELKEAGLDVDEEDENAEIEESGAFEADKGEEEGAHRCSKRAQNNKACNGNGSCNSSRRGKKTAPTKHVGYANTVNHMHNTQHATAKNFALDKGKVIYASQTGHAKALAEQLVAHLLDEGLGVELVDPFGYEPEDLAQEKLIIFVVSTWDNGSIPPHASFLGRWLEDSSADFRVGAQFLSGCKYAVFGVGSRLYGSSYNMAAKAWDQHMEELGATRILEIGEGDEDEGYVEHRFKEWRGKLVQILMSSNVSSEQQISNEKGDEDHSDASDEFYTDEDTENDKENIKETVVDVEDVVGRFNLLGNGDKVLARGTKGQVFRRKTLNGNSINDKQDAQKIDMREMVTPTIRSNLEKQGYKIIGSHSGVKLCRWTKSQLRGRGGCYKHTFYGIESHM